MASRDSVVPYPEDPKLWSKWIKIGALLNLSFFVFLGNMYSAGITTGFEQIGITFQIEDFGKIANLVAWSVFAQGIANLLWMPIALCYGKRLVMIITILIFLVGTVWSSTAISFNSLLGSRILASIGSGSVESLGPNIIGDLFFEQNFAAAMAVYTFSLSAGSQFGPLIGGYLIAARGWRWFFYLMIILIAANFVFVVLTFPETTYKRIYEADQTAADYEEKSSTNYIESRESPNAPRGGHAFRRRFSYSKNVFFIRHQNVEGGSIFKLLYIAALPFGFLLVPATLFTTILYGVVLGWVIVISTLVPTLFSPPPYLFTSKQIGLFSLASFVGTFISFPFAGILTDILSRGLRKRNNGIHKPEHRLPALILPLFICPAGLYLFGYSVNNKENFIVPAVGFAMQSTGLTLVPSVLLSYVVDSFPDTSGEAMVLINAGKNLLAFGLTLKAAPWLMKSGVKDQFIEMASIELGLILILGLILLVFGPWLRHLARHSMIFSPFHS